MTEERILLVEDEPSLVLTLTDRLEASGFKVTHAGDGEAAVALATRDTFDLILLDVALPKKDGFDVCRDLRQAGAKLPILMLTARTQIADKVVGLKLGADDYLTKPFEFMELEARIEALLRRARQTPAAPEVFSFGDITVDFRSAQVTSGSEPLDFSALEFKLLRYFIENQGAVLSRDQLLDDVWGYDRSVYTRTVDVHVSSLRQKIEPTPSKPQYLLTVHGMGYRFVGGSG